MKDQLQQMSRDSIYLKIEGKEKYKLGGTRFGGQPDVPLSFVWPTFEGENYCGEVKIRPLTFLAQFNCEELAQYDRSHLLPDHGLLSFFYETDTQLWGFDPHDKGCARVFWFEDISLLDNADYPLEMEDDFKLPITKINMQYKSSYPGWEDFTEALSNVDVDLFEVAEKELGIEEIDTCSQLLGWPNTIQNSMPIECAFVTQGYYLGDGWNCIPNDVQQKTRETAIDDWYLLFQLDTVENEDFCLMFGDSGRIYFYIRKEDLIAKNFNNVWLILQCY